MKEFKKLIVALSFISIMSACSSQNASSSFLKVGMSIQDVQRYCENEYLIYFQNYVMFSENENNIVAEFNDSDKVKDIHYIHKVEFNETSFQSIEKGTSFVNVIQKIGIPSFIGLEQAPSLDFANNESNIYRIYFSKEGDGFVSRETIILDKDNPASWFDENKLNLPSEEDIKSIKLGMSLDEIVTILGKPQRDIGSGGFLFEFDLLNGKKLEAVFVNNYEKENEYMKDHETIVYGSHYLYLVDYSVKDNN